MSTDQPSFSREQLLSMLAALDIESNSQQQVQQIGQSSIISSPALQPQFYEGQEVTFIYSRLEAVPARIVSINSDNTYNLECFIPNISVEYKWRNQREGLDRVEATRLVSRMFPKVRLCDPRMTFRKQMLPLADAQTVDGRTQTHVDIYSPVLDQTNKPRLQQTPRFHEFHTNIIGCFFDPSLYNFRISCWRGPREIAKGIKTEVVEEIFPKKKPYYETFSQAFKRFFKEYYQGRGKVDSKWDIVQILPVVKES